MKKTKSRVRKGVVVYDRQLAEMVHSRIFPFVRLIADAVIPNKDLSQLEEPLPFLLTHDNEAVRKIGHSIYEGKNVYGVLARSKKNFYQSSDTILFTQSLRSIRYTIRHVPGWCRDDNWIEFIAKVIRRAFCSNRQEAKNRSKLCPGFCFSDVCFDSWIESFSSNALFPSFFFIEENGWSVVDKVLVKKSLITREALYRAILKRELDDFIDFQKFYIPIHTEHYDKEFVRSLLLEKG